MLSYILLFSSAPLILKNARVYSFSVYQSLLFLSLVAIPGALVYRIRLLQYIVSMDAVRCVRTTMENSEV